MKKFVMWGSYCDNVLEKRAGCRQAHLDNLKALKEAGKILTIGPTTDLQMVFGVYVAADQAAAKAMIESDPYWQNQIWTEYQVREWIQAF
ncbi:YciI family protein [Thalassoporum mexicanum]|uniref:YciI family protein n=1 Tax=Thalassoporum mexicanum TaxID=3457544 RepID=UPI0005A2C077